jgi:hypothetical protein
MKKKRDNTIGCWRRGEGAWRDAVVIIDPTARSTA